MIKKLEKEKQLKIQKKNQLDAEINELNDKLKELNSLMVQHEKYLQLKENTFQKIKRGEEEMCQNIE